MNRVDWVLIVFTSLLFMFGLFFIGYNEVDILPPIN